MRLSLLSLSTISVSSLLFGLAFATQKHKATWGLSASYCPEDFLDESQWEYFVTSPSNKDPTNGLVQYVSASDAQDKYKISVVENSIYKLKVETTEEIKDPAKNRSLVRITSQQSFGDGIYAFNITHSPTGCASWPALWTVTEGIDQQLWPAGGEIDVMEGANDEFPYGLTTLHTQTPKDCIIPSKIPTASGIVRHENCSYADMFNFGCQVAVNGTTKPTWGKAFNKVGGALVVMERAFGKGGDGIKVWFWNQGDKDLPKELRDGSEEDIDVNSPKKWGLPLAHFPVQKCSRFFDKHYIIANIDLAGDWALNTWNQTSCPSKFGLIEDHIRKNGSAFKDSWWGIDSIRVWSEGGGTRMLRTTTSRFRSHSMSTSIPRETNRLLRKRETTSITGGTENFADPKGYRRSQDAESIR